MLEGQPVEPSISGRDGSVEQRRVAFAQRDHVGDVVEKREQLAIAPDAALIEGSVAQAAFAKRLLPVHRRARTGRCKQLPASPPHFGQL